MFCICMVTLHFTLRPHLLGPFREAVLTADMQAFNKATSLEYLWNGSLETLSKNYFKFVDYKKNLKIGMIAAGNNISVHS